MSAVHDVVQDDETSPPNPAHTSDGLRRSGIPAVPALVLLIVVVTALAAATVPAARTAPRDAIRILRAQ